MSTLQTTSAQTIPSFNITEKPIVDVATFRQVVGAKRDELAASLPRGSDVDRLIRQVLSVFVTTPQLRQTAAISIFRALIKAGTLDLDPTGTNGEAWFIPFADKWFPEGVLNCVLMVGYKGRVKVAYREPRIKAIDASIVLQKDQFHFDRGTGHISHTWTLGQPRGSIVGAWARVDLQGDDGKVIPKIEVMDMTELARVRASSYSPNSDAWKNWPEEMHKRAPFNRLFKYLPKSDSIKMIEEEDRTLEESQPPAPASVPVTSPATTGTASKNPKPNTGAASLAQRLQNP